MIQKKQSRRTPAGMDTYVKKKLGINTETRGHCHYRTHWGGGVLWVITQPPNNPTSKWRWYGRISKWHICHLEILPDHRHLEVTVSYDRKRRD